MIEPVGFGFAAALDRYVQVRARYPAAEMLMGIGNITELTDADTTGMNALLIGFCQELGIRHVLTTEVIPWARGAVREVDVARRLMHAARRRGVLPKHIDDRLLTVKDARPEVLHGSRSSASCTGRSRTRTSASPPPATPSACSTTACSSAARTSRPSSSSSASRIPAHAFYLGKELMKARLALLLGKTYVQEQPLRWGYLTPEREATPHRRVRIEGRRRPSQDAAPP